VTNQTPESERHVLISGGSKGLGQALVTGLWEAGYLVSTFSRHATPFVEENKNREDFFFSPCDVTSEEALTAFLQEACARFGTPYGLVNCAGIAVDGVLATARQSDIDRVLSINLGGALRLTRLVVRRMLVRSGGGVIVNISSIIGLRGYSGLAAYAASKAGIDAATRALARELGPRSIRVNSIAPGYLETEMTHGLNDAQRRQIIGRTPLRRLGKPEDVVGPLLFLLGNGGRFMTGQTIVVDGGITS